MKGNSDDILYLTIKRRLAEHSLEKNKEKLPSLMEEDEFDPSDDTTGNGKEAGTTPQSTVPHNGGSGSAGFSASQWQQGMNHHLSTSLVLVVVTHVTANQSITNLYKFLSI